MAIAYRILICLAWLAAAVAAVPAAFADEPANFLTRRGDQIMDGDRPFRFISFNIPNLLVIEDAYEFTRPNPWRWPDEFELEDSLESVRQMGGQVARSYVISVRREGSDTGDFVHVRGPGEFNEEGFRALDKMVEIARRKGIRVIVPFVDQHKWWGGIAEYAAFRGKPAEAFWTDRQIIDDFKQTIRHFLERKNFYTGVAYRDEPAIFGWETGNELDSTPEWTRDISAYIKQLDPNHLVIDGRSLHGVPATSLDDPNVDVITTHHYPWTTNHDFTQPIRAAHALTKGKKPYFVGEFGFVETPHIAAAIQTVVDDGISGALMWSLRMHRREGGFYWHMEVGTGRNIYKAFHWPGFASGQRYDEREVMSLIREKAHKIRGIEAPPLTPPAPPTLLPIERASAISWQGAAGADNYDVWRAAEPAKPWQKIAADVSDADLQYQPLFSDATAEPGQSYCYRVVAKNAAGESKPSNAIGPILVRCRTLVDECADLKQLASHESVSVATENARTVQEDCHRLAMPAGSAAVYRVDGPISGWRIFSFARSESANLDVSVSTDGTNYVPAKLRRRAFPSSQSVYGYLTPVLLEGESDATAYRYLRIAVPDAPRDADSPKKAETDTASTAAPVIEIARVEIEYDQRATQSTQSIDPPTSQLPAPVSASVFVESLQPLPVTLSAIDAAAKRGERRMNVVLTVLVDLTDDFHIKTFGGFRGRWGNYQEFDAEMRNRLRDELRQVFARMVEHNMEIFILPHIDPGGRVRTWRNWVDFDPSQKYGEHSYEDLVLGSIADALADTVKNDTRVELALSGEMGTSLFKYPESYHRIVERLRNRVELKSLKVGISLNHGGIAGRGNPNGAKDIQLDDAARAKMQALIDTCDFVGMSFYAPVSVRPTTADFVRGIDKFMDEFRAHGLSVPMTTPMQFSEVGVGGGHNDDDVASDPAQAVESPWAGSGDPRTNPWREPAMLELRRQYHRALLEFLTQQPARWRVSAAFFWSTGSWDPQGIRHPVFADPEIMQAIELHNRAAESATATPASYR